MSGLSALHYCQFGDMAFIFGSPDLGHCIQCYNDLWSVRVSNLIRSTACSAAERQL